MSKIKIPFTDYQGNDLFVGDIIQHPKENVKGIIIDDNTYDLESIGRFRVYYEDCPDYDFPLFLQVGDRGMAVKVNSD